MTAGGVDTFCELWKQCNSNVTLCFPADLLVKAAVHNVDVSADVFKACSFTPVRHEQSCDSLLHFLNINSWIFAC